MVMILCIMVKSILTLCMLVTPKCALWQNILQLILHGQIALMIVHAYLSRSGHWGG